MTSDVLERDIQRGAQQLREAWATTDARVGDLIRDALAIAATTAPGEARGPLEAGTIRELVDTFERLRGESKESLEALLGYLADSQRSDRGTLV